MKAFFSVLLIGIGFLSFSQNVVVDSQTFTPQQLIEDILIDSDCITNINVTNVIGGDFNGTDQSYGFFDASGTSFPFESGIVLSTGRLTNVQGPNTSLSDDDAPNWPGDNDLEVILNESNTTNATIIEFDFTAIADEISFRYIFASEEYQEGNGNTCNFSDLFGFLIRPADQQQYQNIALVPGTNTPVKVTTVHSGIPDACPPINEAFFGSWNDATAPINFNGQTTMLTAIAQTMPNETYHVKLVIADEQNFRFDSAVFLEAGSFQLTSDLGQDLLLANQNPLCGTETLDLNAFQSGNNTYKWFKDGLELLGQTNPIYTVTEAGIYDVEVTLENNCIAYGNITIEYADIPVASNTTLIACDDNQEGLTIYNLYDAELSVINNDQSLSVSDFYLTEMDAETANNSINDPTFFENTTPFQKVYARVVNAFNCFTVAEVVLEISTNTLNIPDFETCDDETVDGLSSFNINDLRSTIEPIVPANATIEFYEVLEEAFTEQNSINGIYENTTPEEQSIFVKVTTQDNQCYALTTVSLKVKQTPLLVEDTTVFYCLDDTSQTLRLQAGILNDIPNNFYYQWFKNGTDTLVNTSFIDINDIGSYQVIVTATNGCSTSRTITVSAAGIANIDDIIVTGSTFNNNTIQIVVSGDGIYEYQLDNDTFQPESIFTNVSAGLYTLTVRDVENDCGITQVTVAVFGIPQYFTPNGDSFNDVWKPVGLSQINNTVKGIQIFNRSGKLLANLNPLNQAWDGTSNGQNLPSDDYWYIITFIDNTKRTGHFALVR